jgi:hypothetical protein
MAGLGGTSPRSKTQKIIWWSVFAVFSLFVAYLLIKNRSNF